MSVDTGTAHIAAAEETNTVVIFAGTSHKHWAPYGDMVKIIYPNLSCYPCSDIRREKCNNYPCLDNIDMESVIKACEQSLENKNL